MPELPELAVMAAKLDELVVGQRLARLELGSLAALKTVRPSLQELEGATVSSVTRLGKHLLVGVGSGPWLVLSLGRAGWVRWRPTLPEARARLGRGPLVLRVGMDGGAGLEVTEAGTEHHVGLWVTERPGSLERLSNLGPDPLAAEFDAAVLGRALQGRRGWLKTALTDQRVLAGIGNAYSDEILHAARCSPFTPVERLDEALLDRLARSIVVTLRRAVEAAEGLELHELKDSKRAGMAVHGRAGLACPDCAGTVREVAFAERSLQYCPTCQTGGRALADRRLSRLLR